MSEHNAWLFCADVETFTLGESLEILILPARIAPRQGARLSLAANPLVCVGKYTMGLLRLSVCSAVLLFLSRKSHSVNHRYRLSRMYTI